MPTTLNQKDLEYFAECLRLRREGKFEGDERLLSISETFWGFLSQASAELHAAEKARTIAEQKLAEFIQDGGIPVATETAEWISSAVLPPAHSQVKVCGDNRVLLGGRYRYTCMGRGMHNGKEWVDVYTQSPFPTEVTYWLKTTGRIILPEAPQKDHLSFEEEAAPAQKEIKTDWTA